MGDRNEVIGNFINEAPVGILKDASSTNTGISGNKFYNTGMNTGVFTPSAPVTLQNVTSGSQGRNVSAARP
jgi:hypothetical protein